MLRDLYPTYNITHGIRSHAVHHLESISKPPMRYDVLIAAGFRLGPNIGFYNQCTLPNPRHTMA